MRICRRHCLVTALLVGAVHTIAIAVWTQTNKLHAILESLRYLNVTDASERLGSAIVAPQEITELRLNTSNAKRYSDVAPSSYTTTTPRVFSRPLWNSSTIASMNVTTPIPDSVEVFYSGTRGDRSGAVILDTLMAHAFAWTLGRKYGGLCGPAHPTATDHRRMIRVLGLEDELPYPLKPEPCEKFDGSGRGMMVYRQVYMDWKDTEIFTPEWIDYIRQRSKLPDNSMHSLTRTPSVKANRPFKHQHRIIVHIRRGDVTPCINDYTRYVCNAHYFHLINNYAKDNNDTFFNVTIYSEAESFEGWQDFNFSHQANVACKLSLDSDMVGAWKDMLGYDDDPHVNRTLVVSSSSFSLVPAILANQSTTQILYTPFWHKPLPHWKVVGPETSLAAQTNTIYLRQQHCSSPDQRTITESHLTNRQQGLTTRPKLNSSVIRSMNITIQIPDSVEVFYSSPRGDRSGSALIDMLSAHAFAWTLGRQYGGMCGPIYDVADDHRRMIQILGLEDHLPYPSEPVSCESLQGSPTSMQLHLETYMDWKNSGIFTTEWLDFMQQHRKLPARGLSSRPKSLDQYKRYDRILVHIRRGDVTPCSSEYVRYTPNAHYFHLINNYARDNNDTFYNVTIYSEAESFESWQDFNFSQQSNVECNLALDGDMADVWRDMLGYNDEPSTHLILVLSFSTFSFVPAMFANRSTTTVIYTPFWHKPLPHWDVVGAETTKAAQTNTLYLRQTRCTNSSTQP